MVDDRLRGQGIPIKAEVTFTEESDSNHLLGRPHQYTAKVNWRDGRLEGQDDVEPGTGSGGSVEIFTTEQDATTRREYIDGIGAKMGALSEYDYQRGVILVRASHLLTPTQAKLYEAALQAF